MLKKLLFIVSLFGASLALAQPTIVSMKVTGDSCHTPSSMGANYASCKGQFINAVPGNTATVFWGDGSSSAASISGQGTTLQFNKVHIYPTVGVYTVKAVLYDALNNATDSATLSFNAFCTGIRGLTYKRNDANCIYDAGIDDIINDALDIEVRKNNVPIDTFTSYGMYYYSIPTPDMTSEFSFRTLTAGTAYNLLCPVLHKIRLDTLYQSGSYGFDFAHNCNASFTGFDLFTNQKASLRTVNQSWVYLHAGNAACTSTNGVLTFTISPKYNYSSASLSPNSISGNTLTWNLSNLSSTNDERIVVYLTPVGTLTPGDTAINTTSISPTTGDNNVANNVYVSIDSIRASFDPNDKSVIPNGNIIAGQLLTYRINFENLGNDTAFNIHIIDTMSNNLDISTFDLIQSSHAVGVSHIKKGSNNIVRFNFGDIKLADKSHPEANKGYVMYQIRAKNPLAPGTEVRNTAHIYFDINPAVVTNTTVSKIPLPNGIKELTDAGKLKLYPNPATHTLFIENIDATYTKVSIMNAVGQQVDEYNLSTGSNAINISTLSKGLYYLSASGSKSTIVLKFQVK
jgi:uncharacterized repeat protein (TIGR01451 family)